MAGVYGEINSRADFFRVLGEATRMARGFLGEGRNNAVMEVIARQLEAMRGWSDNGRDPSNSERESVSLGLIAAREFEVAQGAIGDLREKLFCLNNYFEKWPTDEQAARATDDDFWNDDDDEEDDEAEAIRH